MSKTQKIFLYFAIACILVLPALVYADATPIQYEPIEEIPLAEKPTELNSYVKALFQFGIAVIGIVSMGAIMIGGYLYIFAAGGKTDKAKQMITNALLGLGLALTSWIIVYTINPDLVELKGIRTVAITVNTNVPMPPENTFTLCDVQNASWKTPTDVAIGDSATMVFLMPGPCVEQADNLGINVDVIKNRRLRADEILATINLTEAGGQLTPQTDKPQYLEAKWEIPGTLTEGDKIFFKVTSVTGVVSGEPITGTTQLKSSNELKIFPPEKFDCSIQTTDGVDWVPTPTISRSSLVTEVEVKMTAGCTTARKFSLKVELYNRGDGADHGPKSKEVGEKIVDITQFQVPFSIANPEPGHYFAEATIVYTADEKPFTPMKRSKRGQDLIVPDDDEACKINFVRWKSGGQADRTGINTNIEAHITSECKTIKRPGGLDMFRIKFRVINPSGREIFTQDVDTDRKSVV